MNKKSSSKRSSAQEIFIEKIISANFMEVDRKEELIKNINSMNAEQFEIFLGLIKEFSEGDNKKEVLNKLVGEQQKSYQEILSAIDNLSKQLVKSS